MLKRLQTGFWCLSMLLAASAYSADMSELARTPGGHPDLQGIWYFGSKTPFERPVELGTKGSYSQAEAMASEKDAERMVADQAISLDPERDSPEAGAVIGQEADANFNAIRVNLTRINGEYRTSLIVDPENGRFPFREGAMDIFDRWRSAGYGDFDGPETRPVSERCINGGSPMPPMIGWRYNANMQIVQTADHLMILGEMPGHPRIIPLTGGVPEPGFSKWLGDSLGAWEGETLVIHSRNFDPRNSWFAFRSSAQIQVVERFTLVSPDQIVYRYTVTDPEIYTQPLTVEMSISRRPRNERLFEFACHEGNYSLQGILAGARKAEMATD